MPAAATDGPLDVVALVSGGKDSFYSVLHCLANGHRVLALANLHPPPRTANAGATTGSSNAANANANAAAYTAARKAEADYASSVPGSSSSSQAATSTDTTGISPGEQQHERAPTSGTIEADDGGGRQQEAEDGEEEEETDLNSFMYQTVGHQVIPLYARATGLPLFRQPILGSAVDHGVSYRNPADHDQHRDDGGKKDDDEEDETESLVPLLRAVLKAHPHINALCAGAILSTYQRTRVESVALRLGLVPLAYLWQFPELPLPSSSSSFPFSSSPTTTTSCSSAITTIIAPRLGGPSGGSTGKDDAQLLRDMTAAGLEARVVKVASAGLGDEFLWENVASEDGVARVRRALRRYGAGSRGAVLGEGGEFETLVVDGPPALFKGRIVVREDDRRVVREGGGSAWLSIREAAVEMKDDAEVNANAAPGVRIPGLLDTKFEIVLESLKRDVDALGYEYAPQTSPSPSSLSRLKSVDSGDRCQDWYFVGSSGAAVDLQTEAIVSHIRERLHEHSLPETAITNSIIVLRYMADFPTINRLYGALFKEPNPPSRVTISCGDLLPEGCNITILLTVQLQMKQGDRRGLHVQSRSYWAPANIGPYSQAIAYPVLPSEDSDADWSPPLAVSIAGQIPLVPASMTLPSLTSPPHGSGAELQITLALQHMWRVGAELQVRWWSSAVAYLARPPSRDSPFGGAQTRRRAGLAAAAWKGAHSRSPSDGEDAEESGVDAWDRKYNPTYMTYGGASDNDGQPRLPDWEVLRGFDGDDDDDDDDDDDEEERPVPFVFSAEVEELPRSAGVEWHAHLGFANVGSGSVRLHSELGSPDLHHVIVEQPNGDAFVQTTAVYRRADAAPRSFSFVDAVDGAALAARKSLAGLLIGADDGASQADTKVDAPILKAKLSYIDRGSVDLPTDVKHYVEKGAVIPCGSLWDSQVRRLDMVSIFETRWAGVR
ncbi:adenine nucleotide alpha hydrolases-like protein [Hypoxylon sp. FL1150]|nr:adenine nucleotide alpha hydrolases-like protein [Hypoxylon sp. FL1150]